VQFAAIFAHQGGWDEILMVAGPVLVFSYLLWIARRPAVLMAEEEAAAEEVTGEAAETIAED
jgi:hypothetical protein